MRLYIVNVKSTVFEEIEEFKKMFLAFQNELQEEIIPGKQGRKGG